MVLENKFQSVLYLGAEDTQIHDFGRVSGFSPCHDLV